MMSTNIKNSILLIVLCSFMVTGNSQELTGKKLLKTANGLIAKGETKEAISLLRKNLTKDDKLLGQLSFELGKLYIKEKKLDSADWFFKEAENFSSKNLKKEVTIAQTDLKSLLEKYQIEILSGWRFFDQNKWTEANNSFMEALKIDSGNYEAFQGIGEVLAQQNQNTEAITWYDKALGKYFPSNKELVHAYEHMVMAQFEVSRWDLVVRYANKGIAKEPENKTLFLYKGKALYFQNQYANANNNFIKVLWYDMDDESAWFYSGVCYLKEENYRKSVKALSESIKRDTTRIDAYEFRGEAYFKLEEYKSARNDFEKVTIARPQYGYGINALGICEFHLENYSEAVRNFEKSVEINPSRSYKYNLTKAYMLNNQNEKALEICNAFAKSNRTNIHFNLLHVQTLMNLERYPEAEAYLTECLNTNPFVVEYFEIAEKLYSITGNTSASKNAISIGGALNTDRIVVGLRFY